MPGWLGATLLVHRRWNYPDEHLAPAVASLGVRLPERFYATGFAQAPGGPAPSGDV